MNRFMDPVPAHLGELGPSDWEPYAALVVLLAIATIVVQVANCWLNRARRRAERTHTGMFAIARQFSSDVDEELGRDVRYLLPEDEETRTT